MENHIHECYSCEKQVLCNIKDCQLPLKTTCETCFLKETRWQDDGDYLDVEHFG